MLLGVIKKPRNGKFCNVLRSVPTRDALASKKYAIKKLQPIGISIKEAYGKILENIMGKGSHENSRPPLLKWMRQKKNAESDIVVSKN